MESAKTPSDARVDAAWVASHINDPSVKVVEIDVSPAAYNAGHVPGAVLWNAYTDLRHSDYRPVSAAQLQDILRKSGVASDSTVVFYGYGAHLGFWLLRSHGHDSVRLMDGSREQWKTAGQSWFTEVPILTGSQYALPSERASFSSMEDVQGMIGRPNHVILDTRSKAEYDGERFWPSGATEGAGRAGHIPGAVHMPVELLRTDDGSFRSADEMRQVVRDRGVTSETEVVTYCTIGNRASQAWFALQHLLGHRDVRVYYGSWAEWGKQADTPIEPNRSFRSLYPPNATWVPNLSIILGTDVPRQSQRLGQAQRRSQQLPARSTRAGASSKRTSATQNARRGYWRDHLNSNPGRRFSPIFAPMPHARTRWNAPQDEKITHSDGCGPAATEPCPLRH